MLVFGGLQLVDDFVNVRKCDVLLPTEVKESLDLLSFLELFLEDGFLQIGALKLSDKGVGRVGGELQLFIQLRVLFLISICSFV